MTTDGMKRATKSDPDSNRLRARRIGIDTQYEGVVLMRKDCSVCRSEGFAAHARVRLTHEDRSVIATLYQVTGDLLAHDEAALSESAWRRLGLREGDTITVSHPCPLDSLSKVRGKVYGRPLNASAFKEIVSDIVAGRYSDIHLSSFVTTCSARPLNYDEIVGLTRAMTEAGDRLRWDARPIADKHCVGGLPGNRTTPIVVAIIAACGLTIPKTSSRAITSPAGTADTMETLAPVDVDIRAMRRVVEREGGCVVWGGAVRLSPADDTLIRVERALDLDSEGQLVASVLSKKIAAGSTHLVLDLPVGPTAKVRSEQAGAALSQSLLAVARAFGIEARTVITDGRQPVGRGIGPALEARDVLAVLQGGSEAPRDLRDRSVALAGALLELAGAAKDGAGYSVADDTLEDGRAWRKFQRICEAQGGMREPPAAAHRSAVVATRSGQVSAIDNRRLAKVAKLAGAPDAKAAGLELHVRLGAQASSGEPLYTVHAGRAGLQPGLRRGEPGRYRDDGGVMRPLLVVLRQSEPLAEPLASAAGAERARLEIRRFPDGETYLRYYTSPSKRPVILLCPLDRPDEKFLPLLFAARTARDLGATSVGLVSPYLAYMRQDRRFQPGEAVTSAYFAEALAHQIDWLVTVDPHLHRRSSLSEIYAVPAIALHAAPLIAEWIRGAVERPLLVGPDSESAQWVAAVAREAGAPHRVLQKTRRGDREVEVSVPEVEQWQGHTPVLVDDIVSTARTMIETVGHLARAGMRPPVCIAVHGLFAGDAYQELLQAGASRVVTSNTIPHQTNAIDVTKLLADAVRKMIRGAGPGAGQTADI